MSEWALCCFGLPLVYCFFSCVDGKDPGPELMTQRARYDITIEVDAGAKYVQP